MTAPGYAWTCQGCDANNDAEQVKCPACGLPANFTASQLAVVKPKQIRDEQSSDGEANWSGSPVLFIPEAPIALICFATAPGRIWDLAQHDHVFAALFQFLAMIGVLAGLYFAIIRKERWLAYAAVVAYIACVVCAPG